MSVQSGKEFRLDDFDECICRVHVERIMKLYCETCACRLCETCWGVHDESHKVILLQIKRKQMMLNRVNQCDLGSKMKKYSDLKKQPERARSVFVDLLATCDLFEHEVEENLKKIITLQSKFEKLKNKDASCSDDFVKQLHSDFTELGDFEMHQSTESLLKQFKEETSTKMKPSALGLHWTAGNEPKASVSQISKAQSNPGSSRGPDKPTHKPGHKKLSASDNLTSCSKNVGESTACGGYYEQISYTDENFLDSPHSMAFTISQSYKFEDDLLARIAARFRPLPEICGKLRRTTGNIINFEDRRMTPSRYIYCLITKPDKRNATSTYSNLESCLEKMLVHATENNITVISMPKLGCIDGDNLLWDKVEKLLKKVFANSNIKFQIYL